MVDDEASRKKYALLELYHQEWRREQDSPIRLDKLYRRGGRRNDRLYKLSQGDLGDSGRGHNMLLRASLVLPHSLYIRMQ